MEFFIQFMMIGHLAILILKKFYINGIVWTIVFSLQMVLTEIIPFAYLVFGMFYRLKIYQKKENPLTRSRLQATKETMDNSNTGDLRNFNDISRNESGFAYSEDFMNQNTTNIHNSSGETVMNRQQSHNSLQEMLRVQNSNN